MAKVYDVPADVFIDKLTEILKNEDLPAPIWTSFVKTGSHALPPPYTLRKSLTPIGP